MGNGKQKEVLKVDVTEVLGGGKFYVQTVGDQKVAAIQQQLASSSLQEAPVIGAFNPAKGALVLAQFSVDNSWNRAMRCPKQPGGHECGYVVMRYMKEIIHDSERAFVSRWSTKNRKVSYSRTKLDEVRFEALSHIEGYM